MTGPNFTKVNRKQVSLSKELKGVLVGRYQGFVIKDIMDKNKKGEIKQVPSYHFDLEDGSKITVLGDSGLKNEMETLNPDVGTLMKIEHTGKKDLGGGKTLNTYDIYTA